MGIQSFLDIGLRGTRVILRFLKIIHFNVPLMFDAQVVPLGSRVILTFLKKSDEHRHVRSDSLGCLCISLLQSLAQ